MKTFKSLLFTLLIVLSLTSCEENNEEVLPVIDHTITITSYEWSNTSGPIILRPVKSYEIIYMQHYGIRVKIEATADGMLNYQWYYLTNYNEGRVGPVTTLNSDTYISNTNDVIFANNIAAPGQTVKLYCLIKNMYGDTIHSKPVTICRYR